jgi:formylglycine-generating enzyme required for sulfatase activity
VFVYRNAPGNGPNDWKGVTLRWQHGADGVADPSTSLGAGPGKAELKVLGIEMVYVPGGAFWVGDGATDTVRAQFSVAGGTAPFWIASEAALTLGGRDPKNLGNRDALGMSRAEDFGEVTQFLPAAFPKGFAPFYCMKRQISQDQYVAFLNLLTPAQQKLYGQVGAEGLKTAVAAQPDRLKELPRRDGVIRTLVDPASAVHETDRPDAACAGLMCSEGVAFVAWAGLRPMTELEFEQACRGPLRPAPQADAGSRVPGLWMAGRGPLKPAPDEAVSYWGIRGLNGPLAEQVIAVGNFLGRRFTGTHGDGTTDRPADWPAGPFGFGRRGSATSDRYGMFDVPVLRDHSSHNGFRGVRTAPGQ